MIYANGDKYDGYFLNDKYNGTGKLTYANKVCYEG